MKLVDQYTIIATDETLDIGMLVYCSHLKCLGVITKKESGEDGKFRYSFKKEIEGNSEYSNFKAQYFFLYKVQKNVTFNYAVANDGTLDVDHIAFHIPSKKWVVITKKELRPETRTIIYTADASDPTLPLVDEKGNRAGFKLLINNQPASNFTQNPEFIREFLQESF